MLAASSSLCLLTRSGGCVLRVDLFFFCYKPKSCLLLFYRTGFDMYLQRVMKASPGLVLLLIVLLRFTPLPLSPMQQVFHDFFKPIICRLGEHKQWFCNHNIFVSEFCNSVKCTVAARNESIAPLLSTSTYQKPKGICSITTQLTGWKNK